MSLAQVAELSHSICMRALSLSEYPDSCRIALYHAIHHEVDPDLIMQQALLDKEVFLPGIKTLSHGNKQLVFMQFCAGDLLHRGDFGIPEPQIERNSLSCSRLRELDLLFIPLVGLVMAAAIMIAVWPNVRPENQFW